MAKRPRSVGHLDAVKRGDIIVVTEDGQPAAELRPIGQADDAIEITLRRMAEEGVVARPTRAQAISEGRETVSEPSPATRGAGSW